MNRDRKRGRVESWRSGQGGWGQIFILELLEDMRKTSKFSLAIGYLDGIHNLDFPGETFRIFKEKEGNAFWGSHHHNRKGRLRAGRLILQSRA